MNDKPHFYNGEHVHVHLPERVLYCAIVGLASEHVVDMWIVKALTKPDEDWLISQDYPYSCFVVPGPLISYDYYLENGDENE